MQLKFLKSGTEGTGPEHTFKLLAKVSYCTTNVICILDGCCCCSINECCVQAICKSCRMHLSFQISRQQPPRFVHCTFMLSLLNKFNFIRYLIFFSALNCAISLNLILKQMTSMVYNFFRQLLSWKLDLACLWNLNTTKRFSGNEKGIINRGNLYVNRVAL